jgi:hypothetical protein
MTLVKQVFDIGYFVRALHVQMRFGELSRAPLKLLRLEFGGNAVKCDWMARAADEWDAYIARHLSSENVSTQALQDAIAIRDLLFCALPGIDSASLRVFRQSIVGDPELVITGNVTREERGTRYVSSLAMRAKLLGLRFWLEDGILEALRSEECVMSF